MIEEVTRHRFDVAHAAVPREDPVLRPEPPPDGGRPRPTASRRGPVVGVDHLSGVHALESSTVGSPRPDSTDCVLVQDPAPGVDDEDDVADLPAQHAETLLGRPEGGLGLPLRGQVADDADGASVEAASGSRSLTVCSAAKTVPSFRRNGELGAEGAPRQQHRPAFLAEPPE